MLNRPCCPPSCCPGGAKGAGGILALAVAVVTVAILTHLALLAIALSAGAACWLIAVVVVMIVARYTVRPPVIAAAPVPYRVTATVIPQAVRAEQAREVTASAPPAIENHWHLHLDGQSVAQLAALLGRRDPAPVLRAIPGDAEEAGP